MYLVFFLYIATFLSLTLGEFGQFPFGQTQFSISLTDVILMATLTFLLIWNIAIKKNLKVPKNFYLLTGFWGIGFLSLFFNFNFSGWLYLFRFIIYSSAFYLSFHLVKSGILNTYEFLKLVVGVSLFLVFLGFVQLIFFPDLEVLSIYGYDPHKYRLFSTFLDPNYIGTFLNFGIILIFAQLLRKKFDNFKHFISENRGMLISLMVLLSGVILSFSRSAYLMLFTSIFIILAFKKRMLLVVLFLIPVILYLIFPAFSDRVNGAIFIDDSAKERFYSWDKGLAIFQTHPIFGVGFNNLREVSENLNLNKTYSADGGNAGSGIDSSLLFVLATTGLIGLISFGAFLGRVFYNLAQRMIYHNDSSALVVFALFSGLILNSFFINSLFFPAILFLWFSLMGVFQGLGDGEAS